MLSLIGIEEGAAQSTITMSGAGMSTCAEFARYYRKDPDLFESYYFAWAQGYMTGLNVAMLVAKKPMQDVEAWPVSKQRLHIRTFCDQRPLATFVEAAKSLFEALPKRPPQSN